MSEAHPRKEYGRRNGRRSTSKDAQDAARPNVTLRKDVGPPHAALSTQENRVIGDVQLEIIRLVEQSHLPMKKTLEKLGASSDAFYRWCDLYRSGGHRSGALACQSRRHGALTKSFERGEPSDAGLRPSQHLEPQSQPNGTPTRFSKHVKRSKSRHSLSQIIRRRTVLTS